MGTGQLQPGVPLHEGSALPPPPCPEARAAHRDHPWALCTPSPAALPVPGWDLGQPHQWGEPTIVAATVSLQCREGHPEVLLISKSTRCPPEKPGALFGGKGGLLWPRENVSPGDGSTPGTGTAPSLHPHNDSKRRCCCFEGQLLPLTHWN